MESENNMKGNMSKNLSKKIIINNINNKGFSFIPLVILVLVVGLVGVFSYNSFNKTENVLQKTDPFPSINLNFSAKENSNVIEMYLTGYNADEFVKNLPAELRVQQSAGDEKTVVTRFKNFAKENNVYTARLDLVSDRVILITFLDMKLYTTNVNFNENSLKSPWKYDSTRNAISRILATEKTKLNITYKASSDILNHGTLTFKFTEQSKPVSAFNSLLTFIKRDGYTIEYFCQTAVCPKPQKVSPRVSVDKDGFSFNIGVTNAIKKVTLNIGDYNSRLDVTSVPERWSLLPTNDGIVYSSYGVSAQFRATNDRNVEFILSGDGQEFFNLIKNLRVNGFIRSDCGDFCTEKPLVTPFRNTYNNNYVFNVPVISSTKTIKLYKTPADGSFINIIWLKNSIPGWQVTQDKYGIERVRTAMNPVVTITERKDPGNTSYFFFTIEGYGDNFNKLSSDIKKGIELSAKLPGTNSFEFFPSPTACNSFDGKCQFGINASVDNTYFLFRTDIKIDFKQIPAGWKVNGKSNGITK